MAMKIGTPALIIILLGFLFTMFSLFVNEADAQLQVDSGVVNDRLSAIDSGMQSDTQDIVLTVVNSTDTTESFNIQQAITVDTRGTDTSGIFNLKTKSIVGRLFTQLSDTIPGFTYISAFVLTIIGVFMSILILRSIGGEGRF